MTFINKNYQKKYGVYISKPAFDITKSPWKCQNIFSDIQTVSWTLCDIEIEKALALYSVKETRASFLLVHEKSAKKKMMRRWVFLALFENKMTCIVFQTGTDKRAAGIQQYTSFTTDHYLKKVSNGLSTTYWIFYLLLKTTTTVNA